MEVEEGDANDPDTLARALTGVDSAYYLIHSMTSGSRFAELDLHMAGKFGRLAGEAGVRHLIYLGGLGNSRGELSPHLRSRQQTGNVLRAGPVPVTEFRAAVIIGAGSLSFEMIRNLVERLPLMICPRWIYSRVQPIAVDDVLTYLVAALDSPRCRGRTIEIGGGVTTYGGLMLAYAKARRLRRRLVPVPVLTPRLSSYWVHWVTPVHAGTARALVEGLRNDTVVTNELARELFPGIAPASVDAAVGGVIAALEQGRIETSWSDAAGAIAGPDRPVGLQARRGLIFERRRRLVHAPPECVYAAVAGIGGRRGWFFANWAWGLRGRLDRLLGGVGLRRGRRHPDELRVGDALDFWRVEAVETQRLLRLRAEMKLPGKAWLQFEIRPAADGSAQLLQSAAFAPKGLTGLLYWYVLYPVHAWIFAGMIRRIAIRAESIAKVRRRMTPAESLRRRR